MTLAAKITYLGALLIGLLVGAAFGFRNASDIIAMIASTRPTTVPAVVERFSFQQYRRADLEHARAALLDFVSFLAQMQKFHPERSQAHYIANTYTRLALLEDAAHDPEESHAYMAKARYWYGKSASGHSDSEIKAAMRNLDEAYERIAW
jgi:hypothetical protein